MKLLLLQPPIQDFYDTPVRLQPLGLGYLKAAVKKHIPEVEVAIKDYHQGWGKRVIPLPDELAYLRNFYAWRDQSPFCLFHDYSHYGASFDALAQDVKSEQPDVVGISSLFTPYYREVLAAADAIKKKLDVPVLIGGSHVSAAPEVMLRHPSVDFVIRGEGEKPLVEFLREWRGGKQWGRVPGLGFKLNGEGVCNPVGENYSWAELPVPDFSDFPAGRYTYEGRPMAGMIMSRGCPETCAFCAVHLTFGRGYRRRRTEDVLAEMRVRYAQGVRVFDFEDDNLATDREAMKDFCAGVAKNFPSRDVRLLAMNGISYLTLDDEILGMMRQAGFTDLNLSLVSASADTCGEVLRRHGREKYEKIVCRAADLGFRVVSYQILGLPGDTLEAMIQTLQFQTRLPVLLGASPFYLTPGIPMARFFSPRTDADLLKARLSAMAVETDQFFREDLYTLLVTTRILNFLKGLDLPSTVMSLQDALETTRGQGPRARAGAEIFDRLLREKTLYAWTRQGLKKLPCFRRDLFGRVWEGLGSIATLRGSRILTGMRERQDDLKAAKFT